MKLLRQFGKKLSSAFWCVLKEIRWELQFPSFPVAYLVPLVEIEDLNVQELFDGMKQVEKKGYTVIMIPSIWLRDICRERAVSLWASEKREGPMPQWIYLICF